MILPVPCSIGWLWVTGKLTDAQLFLAAPDCVALWEPFHVWLYRIDGQRETCRFFRSLKDFAEHKEFSGLITETCAAKTRRWASRFHHIQCFGERRHFPEGTVRQFFSRS
jgi:hypothetical protein